MAQINLIDELPIKKFVEKILTKDEFNKIPEKGLLYTYKDLKNGSWLDKIQICISEVPKI